MQGELSDERREWAREILADVLAIEQAVADFLGPMLNDQFPRRGPGDGPTPAELRFTERHAQLVDRCLRRAESFPDILDDEDEGDDEDEAPPAPPRSPSGKFSLVEPKPGDLL